MNAKDIETLLNVADLANQWPRLSHLRDAALKELEAAKLETESTIQNVAKPAQPYVPRSMAGGKSG
jgi:hypothetical protein